MNIYNIVLFICEVLQIYVHLHFRNNAHFYYESRHSLPWGLVFICQEDLLWSAAAHLLDS